MLKIDGSPIAPFTADQLLEIANGLNPLVNDANADLDLDGVPNLQEYLHGLDPRKADTAGDGHSDYERLYGQKAAKCYYDGNDRLISGV